MTDNIPLYEPTPNRTFRFIKDPPALTLTFADGTPLLTASYRAWNELAEHLDRAASNADVEGTTYEVWDHDRYADHSVMKVRIHYRGVFRVDKYPIHLKLWHEKGVNTFKMRVDEARDFARLIRETLDG